MTVLIEISENIDNQRRLIPPGTSPLQYIHTCIMTVYKRIGLLVLMKKNEENMEEEMVVESDQKRSAANSPRKMKKTWRKNLW